MRKLLISAVLFLTTSAFSQSSDKTVVCDDVVKIVSILVNDYQEQLIWVGLEEKSKLSLFANFKTQSWSLVQFNDTKACLMDVGQGFQFNSGLFNKSSHLINF